MDNYYVKRLDVPSDQLTRLTAAWADANGARDSEKEARAVLRKEVLALVKPSDSDRAAQLIAAETKHPGQHIDDWQDVLMPKFLGAVYCGVGEHAEGDWCTANAIYDFVIDELHDALARDPLDHETKAHLERWELVYRAVRAASGMMEADRLNEQDEVDAAALDKALAEADD